jgi:hypothetical protein
LNDRTLTSQTNTHNGWWQPKKITPPIDGNMFATICSTGFAYSAQIPIAPTHKL